MKKSLRYAFLFAQLLFGALLQLGIAPVLSAHGGVSETSLVYRFTENKGQWPEAVKFRAELPDGKLYLEENRLTYFFLDIQNSAFPKHHGTASDPRQLAGGVPTNLAIQEGYINAHAYRVNFLESRSKPFLRKDSSSSDYSNYFYGDYSAQEVYAYHKVTYQELYPEIDLVFYSQGRHLKYDFVLQKAKAAQQIKLYYEGAERVFIRQGKLVIQTSINEVIEEIPYAYQKTPSGNKPVRCAFQLLEPNTVGFVLADGYDPELPLVIDPVLVFSTFTGSLSDNWGYTATYDQTGALYSGGIVHDVGFPVSVGAMQVGFGGQAQGNYPQSLWYGSDIALIKYNPTGTNRLWATYLGGSFNEQPHSLIVNANNELFMLGATRSANFPVTAGCYDPTFNGKIDMVVARINATGTVLQGSTYLGGNLDDGINQHTSTGNPLYKFYADDARGEIILSEQGEPIIVSSTASPNFPVTPGVIQSFLKGQQDAVFLKLSSNLTNLIFSTFLGGNLFDAGYSVRLMDSGEYYVVGGTNSATGFLTTPGTWQPNYQGGASDGFILRINSGATAVLQGSYVGANNYDQVFMLDYDDNNDIYMVGQTASPFPVFNAPYSIPNAGQFIIKMPPNLNSPIFSARFGSGNGQPDITISAFMVDKCQNIYVSGWGGLHNSGSTQGLPTTPNAFKSLTDGADFYLCVFNKDMASLQYATFFGGNVSQEHVDGGTSRFDKNGIIYQSVCAGCGGNNDFPITPGAWSATNNASNCNNGNFKFQFELPNAVYADFNSVQPGCAPYSVTFSNTSTGAVGYEWNFGPGFPPSNQMNPTVTFQTPGVYTVSLKALNPGKCNQEDQIKKIITVNPAPVFTLQPSANSACVGETLSIGYSGSILPGSSYQWNFNGGVPASAIALGPHVVSWNTPGTKTITLNVTINGCAATQTAIVTILPNPSPPAVNPVSRCGAGALTFTATPANPLPEQILLFATPTDNTPIATVGSSPFVLATPVLSSSTTFYIEARNGNCKSNRVQAAANIHPITPTPFPVNVSRCGPGSVTITVNAFSAQTASLYVSSTSTTPLASAAAAPFSFTPFVSATTTYFLEANNSLNCPSERVPVVVTIHSLPATPIVQNLSQCGPSTFTFSVSNSYPAGSQLDIFNADCSGAPIGSVVTQPFLFITSNVTTTSVFFFQVKDAATGCLSACANATATVIPLPGLPFAAPVSVCAGQTATFTAHFGVPPGSLVRLFTQENASTPIQTISNPAMPFSVGPIQTTTTFYLEAVAQNCSSARSSLAIEVLPNPQPPSAPNVSRCGPGSVTLSITDAQLPIERVELFFQPAGGNAIVSDSQAPFLLATPILSSSATFYLEAVNASGCRSSRQAVNVSILPVPGVISLPPRQICGPGPAELTVPQTLSSGTQIEFYNSGECEGTPLATSTTPASVLHLGNLQSSTTYYYRINHLSTGCKSSCVSFTYTVLPVPTEPLAEAPAVCLGQTSRILAQMGAVPGSSIALYTTATAMQPNLTLGASPYQFLFSHAAPGVYTYYLETTLGDCKSPRVSVEHTVHPLPQNPQAPAISRCGGGALSISVLPGSIAPSSIVQLFETQSASQPLQSISAPPYEWMVNVATTSTFWLSATNPITQCASAKVPVVVTILPLPALPGPFVLSRCGQGNVTLTVAQGTPPFTEARIYTQPVGGNFVLSREASNLSFLLASQPPSYWLETYNANTGCSSGRTPITITEHPIPVPPTVPNVERCLAGDVTFSVNSVLPGHKVYLYTSSSANLPIDSTQNTTLTRNVTASSTFYWQSLDLQTGCRSERSFSSVTVHDRPSTPEALPINVCPGQSFTIEVTTTYSQVVALQLLDANQNLVAATNQAPYSFPLSSISASTQFYLRAINIVTGCTSLLGQVPVTLVPNPPAPIVQSLSRCGPGSLTATLQIQSANTIAHIYEGPAAINAPIQTINAAPYIFTSSLTATRIFTAIAELQPWGCKSLPVVFNLTVLPVPSPPSVPSVARCYSGSVTFTVTPTDLDAEEISLFAQPGGNAALHTVHLPNVNLVSPIISTTTSYYVGVRNAQTGCVSENVAVVATIHSTAEPAALALQNCGPASLTFTAGQGEVGADRIILWDAQNQALEVKSSPYVFALPFLNNSTTFFLQSYNSSTGCSSSLRPLPVTIHPIPAAPSANSPQSCGAASLTFTLQPNFPAVEVMRIFPDMQQAIYSEISAPFIFTTPFLSQTTSFYVSAYNLQTGCQSERVPIVAHIAPIPAAPLPLRLLRCGPGDLTFTVQNPNSEPSHIQLYTEDGAVLLATAEYAPYAFTVSLNQSSRYQIVAFNPQTGCRSQAKEVEVILHPIPEQPLATVQTACGNTSVQLNITGGAPSANELRILDANQNILLTITLPSPPVTLPYAEGVTYQLIGYNAQTGCFSPPLVVTPQPNPNPAAPSPVTLERCGPGSIDWLFTASNNWRYAIYATPLGGVPLYTVTESPTNLTLENITQSSVYYIEAIDIVSLCPSPRSPLTLRLLPVPQSPVPPQNASRCGPGRITISGLFPQNTWSVRIYNDPEGTNLLSVLNGGNVWTYETPPLGTDTQFFMAYQDEQTGCRSPLVPVRFQILPLPPVPIPNHPSRCGAGNVHFTVLGEQTILLYTENQTLVGSVSQPPYRLATPFMNASTTFYLEAVNPVTQCSSQRVQAPAIIHPIPAAPVVANIQRCGPGEVTINYAPPTQGIITARLWGSEDENILLQTLGAPFVFSWNVTSSSRFWLSVQTEHCESPKSVFQVVTHPVPASPTAPPITQCANSGVLPVTFTAIMGAPEGTQISVYTSPFATQPILTQAAAPYHLNLDASVGVSSTFYLESQNSVTGCKSARAEAVVALHRNPILPSNPNAARCGEGIVELNIPFDKVYEYKLYGELPPSVPIAGNSGSALQFATNILTQSRYFYFQLKDITTGCTSAVAPIWVELLPIPSVPVVQFPQSLCVGENLKVSHRLVPGTEYWWEGPNGFTYLGNELFIPHITTAYQGLYTVRAINAAQCTSEVALHRLRVIETAQILPEPGYYNVFGEQVPLCVGQEINLVVKNFSEFPEGAQFEWRGPHQFYSFPHPFPGVPRPIELHHAGVYQVRAHLGSCVTDWASIDIAIYDKPRKPEIYSNAPVCRNDSALTLWAHSPGAVEYYWIGPGAFAAQTAINEIRRPALTENSGVYSVTAVNAYGCFSDTGTLAVQVTQVFNDLMLHYPASVCEGQTIAFEISNPIPGATYVLRGPAGFEATARDRHLLMRPDVRANASGIYTLTATVGNCVLPPANFPVSVKPQPLEPIIAGSRHACSGQSIILSAAPPNSDAAIVWEFQQTFFEGNQLLLTPARLEGSNEHFVSVYAIERGCTSERVSVELNIHPAPEIPLATSAFEICRGQSITLELPNLPISGKYLWAQPGHSYTVMNESYTLEPEETGVYSIVSVVNGCTSAPALARITVNALPARPVIQPNGNLCLGSNLLLRAIGSGDLFLWNGPLISNRVGQQLSISNLNFLHNGTYSVVTVQKGCTSEVATFPIAVKKVSIEQIFSNDPLCVGQNLLLTAFTNAPQAQYLWQGPANFRLQTSSPQVIRNQVSITEAGVYSVTVISQGCTSLPATLRVEIRPLPPAVLIKAGEERCEGENLSLTLEPEPAGLVQWFFPDGSFYEGVSANYWLSPNSNGNIRALIQENGCSTEARLPLVVTPIPATPIAPKIEPVCEGDILNLSARAASVETTFLWRGPNQFWAIGQSTTFTAAHMGLSGQYTVAAIERGCTSGVATFSVQVHAVPSLEYLTSNSPLCAGQTLNLQTNPIANAEYQWRLPSGEIVVTTSASLALENVTEMSSGIISVRAIVNNCASLPVETLVKINPPLQNIRAVASGPHCGGETLTLTALGSSSYRYFWSGPNNFSRSGQTLILPGVGTDQAGLYQVWAVAEGCTSNVASVPVVVHALPGSPSVTHNSPLCAGQTLTLSVNTIPGAVYLWQGPAAGNPSGFLSTQQNPIRNNIQSNDAGFYSLTVRLGSCTSTTVIFRVEVLAAPRLPVVSNNGPVCAGETLQLQAPWLAGATYLWQGPAGFVATQNSPSLPGVTALNAGEYSLTVTQNGCVSQVAYTQVSIVSSPVAFFSDTLQVCAGATVRLNAPAFNNVIYQWIGPPATGFASSQPSPTILNVGPRNQGDYRLFVELNGCRFFARQTRLQIQNCRQEALMEDIFDTRIYPNPSTGVFTLILSPEVREKLGSAELVDAKGRRIHRFDTSLWKNEGEIDINIASTSGIYFLLLQLEDKQIAHKLIIR